MYDETAAGVEKIDGDGIGLSVVRRPNLQMPDLAFVEQEGHHTDGPTGTPETAWLPVSYRPFLFTVTVYRLANGVWKPYLCKSTETDRDPNRAVVADSPCR